jgi:hypothetical protein
VKRWGLRLAEAAAVLACVLLAVGLTPVPTGEQDGSVVRTSLAGQAVRLSLPAGEGRPKGIALWFHGQGGGVDHRVDSPWLEALRRDGWVIASSDFHQTSWGNAASTDDTRRLIDWAEAETGLDVELWVSGSMGGAVSLNALTSGVEAPPCWYGVKPAISLTRMDRVPGARMFIQRAYRGPVPVERDPVRNLSSLPVDTAYRVVASKDDSWVLYDENTEILLHALLDRGADVSLLPAHGLHEDPSHWNGADLVRFADACLPTDDTSLAAD